MGGVYIHLESEWSGNPEMIPVADIELDFWRNSSDGRVESCPWGNDNILFLATMDMNDYARWQRRFYREREAIA